MVRTRDTGGYCLTCWPTQRERFERRKHRLDPRGSRPGDPRKSARWQRVRALYLGSHPVCEQCTAAEATQVHHVHGLAGGGAVFELGNLQAVCTRCHAQIEAGVRA